MLSTFFSDLIAGLLLILIPAAIGFFWRTSQALKALVVFMDQSQTRHDMSEMRHDISDMLWSQEYKTSISTKHLANGITKGSMEFPKKPKRAD